MDSTILALLMVLGVCAFGAGVHAYLTNKERRQQAKSGNSGGQVP